MADCEILPHPTDLRVRVRAHDRRELFERAALATFELIARPLRSWPDALEREVVEVGGDDETALLRALLAECVYRFEVHGFLAREVRLLALEAKRCRMELAGARFPAEELDVEHVIKAVTWHGLAIVDEPGAARDASGRRACVAEILYDL